MDKIKEMVYQKNRKRELLCSDEYNGFKFYVMNLGTHPTAYVEIPKESYAYNKGYHELEDKIDVHGGLTYSDDFLDISDDERIKGWFIGWDYSHYNDYIGYEEIFMFDMCGKKWTTEEIIKECKNVIEQLVEAQNEKN